jgi:hypothetical protein
VVTKACGSADEDEEGEAGEETAKAEIPQHELDEGNDAACEEHIQMHEDQESHEAGSTNEGFLTSTKFEDLDISDKTKKALREMKLEHMTHIQAKAIPPLLGGADIVGKA